MGCNCVLGKSDGDIETGRLTELSSKFHNNKRLLHIVIRIQSMLRGMMVRRKYLKAMRQNKFIPNESSIKYNYIATSKIKDEDIQQLFKNYPPLNDGVPVTLKQTVEYENHAEFYGEWANDSKLRYGRGIQIWLDGSKYEGYWKNDKANFKGKLTHADGDIYEGGWLDDKAEGYGVYTHTDGAKYLGYWKNDKQEGKGKEIWPDGTSYEGEYKQGMKNGKGKFTWNDGSVYEGNFVDNNIEGYGSYTWGDERQYTGTWKNNKMDGQGIFTWPDGRKYEGGYKNDKKEGYGTFKWAEGKEYRGNWKNGKQHGEGEFYNVTNKRWKKGIWEEGKRLKWIDEEPNNEE